MCIHATRNTAYIVSRRRKKLFMHNIFTTHGELLKTPLLALENQTPPPPHYRTWINIYKYSTTGYIRDIIWWIPVFKSLVMHRIFVLNIFIYYKCYTLIIALLTLFQLIYLSFVIVIIDPHFVCSGLLFRDKCYVLLYSTAFWYDKWYQNRGLNKILRFYLCSTKLTHTSWRLVLLESISLRMHGLWYWN